jgi:mannitol/fructose-specific phosphotransferase system IIA component
MSIISFDTIALGAHAADKFDAIRQAGELLVRGGRVLPEYVADMLAREQSMSTSMNNGVAIPHGKDPNVPFVLQTGISVLQLAEGVPWDEDETVSLVIGIAALEGQHIGVLTNLAEVVEDEDKLAELLQTQDPQVILDYLNAATLPEDPSEA